MTRKWWFYGGKVRDPRAEDLPGAARDSGRTRGRSAELFRRHPGSPGEGFGGHFESKNHPSGSKPTPGRFLRVARRGGRALGPANHHEFGFLNEVSKPQRVRTSERMQRLGHVAREIAHGVHVPDWSAATLFVPTGELRRACSLQGRRMWPQASSIRRPCGRACGSV